MDLFCGIGGLTHGFVTEGFHVAAGIDSDASCRYAYETGNGVPFIAKDLFDDDCSSLVTNLFKSSAGGFRVLVGCAPCQPFSKYTTKGRRAPNDANAPDLQTADWKLVQRFAQIICEVGPDIVSMENVPELAKHEFFRDFCDDLESSGYKVTPQIIDCTKYGIPQTRDRLVLLASRLAPIAMIPFTQEKPTTLREAIGHLPVIKAGESHEADPIHRSSRLSPLNMTRIRHTPEGGGWKDWPEELRLQCHKKKSGQSYGSVYGRMKWDEPAPTMTTECYGLGSGRFGHPEQDRAISLREAALIQTFPEDYRFLPDGQPVVMKTMGRHIGNAVPVRLGKVIAQSIARHLEQYVASPGTPSHGSPHETPA